MSVSKSAVATCFAQEGACEDEIVVRPGSGGGAVLVEAGHQVRPVMVVIF